MKKISILLLFVITFPSLNGTFAQPGSYPYSGLPLNPKSSPIFGTDILINDQPAQNQRKVALCSAFNGWLFAAYTYSVGNYPYLSISKSMDDGVSWSVLYNEVATGPHIGIEKIDAIVIGDTPEDLKLILCLLLRDSITGITGATVPRFKCQYGRIY